MSDDDKRNKGREDKPLLAFSDAPVPGRADDDSPGTEPASVTPPWTPPATPEERAALYRTHRRAADTDIDTVKATDIRDGMDEIKEELDRAIEERAKEKAQPDTQDRLPAAVPEGALRDTGWKPLVDPRIAFDIVRGSRKFLFATTLLGGVVGALYALSLPQTYIAATDILVDPRNIRTVGTELTPGTLPTDASLAIAESQARMIDSSSVLLKVIEKTDLTKDPEFNGTLVPTGVAGFFAQIADMFRSKKASDEQTVETRVLYNLHKSLTINRDAKTFIYSIAAKTRDPEKSALLANTVSTVFQDELDSLQSDAARRTSEELAKRLTDMSANVERAEKAAADFRASHDLVDVDGKLIRDSDLSRLNEQLTNQRAETTRLQARVDVMNSATSQSVVAGTLPEDFRSATLTALRAQYAQTRQTANGLATNLGPRHPQLIQAQSQASAALGDIDSELRRIRSSLQVEVQRSAQQEKELSARLAQLKAQQANSNDDLVKLRELEREASTLRSVYEAFLLRTRETGEQEGIRTTNIRVLSEARPPLDPASTSRKLIVIAGLILGLLAGLAITLLRNFGRLVRLS